MCVDVSVCRRGSVPVCICVCACECVCEREIAKGGEIHPTAFGAFVLFIPLYCFVLQEDNCCKGKRVKVLLPDDPPVACTCTLAAYSNDVSCKTFFFLFSKATSARK